MKPNSKKAGARASLSVLLLLLILVMSGCSAIKYFTHEQPAEEKTVYRFPISRAEIKKFFGSIRASEQDLDALYKEACYFQDHRKHKFALQNFRRILEIDPHYVKAYNGMGVSYDMLGNSILAIQAYQKALEIDPQADYVYNNLGYSYFLQGDMDRAIGAYQTAVSLDGSNKTYRNNLGLAYARKGELNRAYAEFKSGGEDAKAHYYLGKILYDQGSYNLAFNHLTKAVEIEPTMQEARRGLEASASMAQILQPKPLSIVKAPPADSLADTPTAQAEQENSRQQLIKAAKTLEREPIGKGRGERTPKNQERMIEISNGNGVNRMAKRVGHYLIEHGFGKPCLTNASHFNFSETTIYYCDGYLQTAHQLAERIPGNQNMERVVRLARPETKIKVRIGKDLIPYAPVFESS